MPIRLEAPGSCSRLADMEDISIFVQSNNVLSNKHISGEVSHL